MITLNILIIVQCKNPAWWSTRNSIIHVIFFSRRTKQYLGGSESVRNASFVMLNTQYALPEFYDWVFIFEGYIFLIPYTLWMNGTRYAKGRSGGLGLLNEGDLTTEMLSFYAYMVANKQSFTLLECQQCFCLISPTNPAFYRCLPISLQLKVDFVHSVFQIVFQIVQKGHLLGFKGRD